MEAIKIHVSNSSAKVTQKPKHITAGMIGLPVEFDFDEEWEQLRRELRENRRLFCQNISGRDRMMMTLLGHCARSVAHHLLTLRSSL